MKVSSTNLPEVLVIEPDVFGDERGYFLESFRSSRYREAGLDVNFVQDNLSYSQHGVLRGLHFQQPRAQGKLVTVLAGEVFDVAVDIRRGSPDFGAWTAILLSAENHKQLWIPQGFAHGFCVTSESALFMYKCTDYYSPETEHCIHWRDQTIAIDWPVKAPIISAKDDKGVLLASIEPELLPTYRAP